MQKFLLGVSLTANAVLGYLLLKDEDTVEELRERLEHASDEVVGKVQQAKGSLTGDTEDKVEGAAKEAKSAVEDKAQDVKDAAQKAAE
ncbi:CsbD family protein [Ligilactobacillus pobuzihii]|uniref:Uncharacterized protein n=1 Tax=Ligilactobacillus pobuzihii TaxID=449659 RepID=A0A0R2L2K0_9LACO|nr:CsbD family protein [Ligilactobacillus pobuzihii]KRK11196.1 hypothetical protein FD11_GL000892 [Ligilactobacillus pobuzihii E100301 = KCTC 13174]KRN95858.1 hypothetical protein IV66_GL000881 [Ligilactobacillus pobuzihii]GEN47770.1 hypothetical protein LPO01_05620 [Ligilactobacillus pobuzihii]